MSIIKYNRKKCDAIYNSKEILNEKTAPVLQRTDQLGAHLWGRRAGKSLNALY